MDKYGLNINTFDELAEKYQAKYMDFEFYWAFYDEFLKLLTTQNASVLDVGCGPGNAARYLFNRRPDLNILGVDSSPAMIDLAKVNVSQAEFKVMDCREINKVEQTFDAIMCGFCTPYLEKDDVINLIRDMSSLLNPDGVLYLSTMEGEYEKSELQSSSDGQHQVFTHYYSEKFLVEHIKENSLQPILVKRKIFSQTEEKTITDMCVFARKN